MGAGGDRDSAGRVLTAKHGSRADEDVTQQAAKPVAQSRPAGTDYASGRTMAELVEFPQTVLATCSPILNQNRG